MSHTSMIFSVLMSIAMVIYIAPNIIGLNRGHILRNIALWLAIFLGLALIYQNFGPGGAHPMFQQPDAMQGMNGTLPKIKLPATATPAKAGDAKGGEDKADEDRSNEESGEQGYTPPKEE